MLLLKIGMDLCAVLQKVHHSLCLVVDIADLLRVFICGVLRVFYVFADQNLREKMRGQDPYGNKAEDHHSGYGV